MILNKKIRKRSLFTSEGQLKQNSFVNCRTTPALRIDYPGRRWSSCTNTSTARWRIRRFAMHPADPLQEYRRFWFASDGIEFGLYFP